MAAIIAVVLAFAAAGCGSSGKSAATTTITTVTTLATTTNPTNTVSVTTHGRFHYPAALITSYMQSCTKGGATKQAYCACTLDKLSNDVSAQDFVRIGLAGGVLPKRIHRLINKAAVACIGKL